MENILIITNFERDTLQALQVAGDLIQEKDKSVVLFSISEGSSSITDLLFLPRRDSRLESKAKRFFDDWSKFSSTHHLTELDIIEHHQYGVSRPVIGQLLKRFSVSMIIVPSSVSQSDELVHRLLLRWLNQSELPVMTLPRTTKATDNIRRALFLDHQGALLQDAIQGLPFHVIHQSMITDRQNESLQTMTAELKINLIVKPKKLTTRSQWELSELGLPVLSV